MTKHYYKALVANTITATGGTKVPFVALSNGDGVIATDDPVIQASLDIRIKERRGGVAAITEEQYAKFIADDQEAKKNAKPSRKPFDAPRLTAENPSLVKAVEAAPAARAARRISKSVPAVDIKQPASIGPAAPPAPELGAP